MVLGSVFRCGIRNHFILGQIRRHCRCNQMQLVIGQSEVEIALCRQVNHHACAMNALDASSQSPLDMDLAAVSACANLGFEMPMSCANVTCERPNIDLPALRAVASFMVSSRLG